MAARRYKFEVHPPINGKDIREVIITDTTTGEFIYAGVPEFCTPDEWVAELETIDDYDIRVEWWGLNEDGEPLQ